LRIDRSSQMNLVVASRFRDIKEIHINSLFELTIEDEDTDDEYKDMRIDFDTKISVVPFLAKFDSLERVVFGIKEENGHDTDGISPVDCYFFEGDEGYPNEGVREMMLSLLDMFSGAYKVGALQKNIQISGLCCPDSTDRQGMRGNNCSICTRACKHFPLESVVEFECRGTSSNNALSLRSHGLDVCLERAKIESIIETRQGGKDMLRSDKRLLYLLGRGRRYIIPSNDDGEEDVQKKALHIVKYQQEELDEIKRVINYAELDVKKLSKQSVSSAIRQSFAMNSGMTPSEDQCYISDSSLGYLQNKLGLPINKEDFERPLAELMGHTQQIVWVLNQCDLLVNDDGTRKERELHKDIELDCLRLVRQFLEVESNPPIQQMTKAIPTLTNQLEKGFEYKVEAATSLQHILTIGTTDQRKMIVDEGAITKFSRLLDSPNISIAKLALHVLVDITAKGTAEIKTIAEAGAISSLTRFLDKDDDSIIKNSLLLLVTAKDRINDRTQAALLPKLVKMIQESTSGATTDTLTHCSILLRKVLETKKQERIQIVFDSIVPKLIEMMKSTQGDGILQTNMSHVMINLLSGGTKEQVDMLVKDTNLLHQLVSVVKSGHKAPPRGEQPLEQPSSPVPSARSSKSNIKRTVIRLPHNGPLGLTIKKSEDGSTIITGVKEGEQGEKYGCRVGEVPVVISKGKATKIPYEDFIQQAHTSRRPVVFSVLRTITQDEGKKKNTLDQKPHSAISSPSLALSSKSMERIDMGTSSEFSSHLLKKAINIVGKVANMATEYQDLLLQMGIMESLMHVLDNKPPPHITKAVALSFEQFCGGKPVDFNTSQAWLKVIPQLFLSNDAEVTAHACEALFRILSGLKEDELNQVIGTGLVDVECLLKKFPFVQSVQQAAFKSIHLISNGDDVCIKAIVDHNGMDCISKTLFSTDESHQVLACQALLSLLSHDEGLVQTAIDNNAQQGLLQMLKVQSGCYIDQSSKQIKKLVLNIIRQMTKTQDSSQIKRLVASYCVQQLCGVLTDDCDIAIIALQSLRDILNVGNDEEMQNRKTQFGNQIPSKSVRETEKKLDMLMNEIKDLEQQDACVVLLQQKKAWLEFHIQNERVSSITKAIELLKQQQNDTAASFESIKDDISMKEDKIMKCFEKQIKSAEGELSVAQTKLDHLEKEAEKGVHLKEWSESENAKDDLSAELELVTKELERATVKLESMRSTRSDRGKRKSTEPGINPSSTVYDTIGAEIGRLFLQDYTRSEKENEPRPNVRNIIRATRKVKKVQSRRRVTMRKKVTNRKPI